MNKVSKKLQAEEKTLQKLRDRSKELLKQNHDIEQYISEMPDLMAKTDNNEQLKMEVLQGLGVGVYMYQEGEYKYADWALFGKSFIPNGAPSSLRAEKLR